MSRSSSAGPSSCSSTSFSPPESCACRPSISETTCARHCISTLTTASNCSSTQAQLRGGSCAPWRRPGRSRRARSATLARAAVPWPCRPAASGAAMLTCIEPGQKHRRGGSGCAPGCAYSPPASAEQRTLSPRPCRQALRTQRAPFRRKR